MREVYLDNCATTRVDDAVAAVALDVMLKDYGNPSSLHKKGFEAQRRLETARGQVARALGGSKESIVFTSGGTEANNLALLGGINARKRGGKGIVTTAWEHSSVLAPLQQLEKEGYALTLVKPERDGHIDIDSLVDAVNADTVLLSCMMVNAEVGSIADIAELTLKVRRKNPGTLVHCDAVQAFGKLPFSAKRLGVDFISVSGHKIHAPKGAGALYIKKGVRIIPRVYGGGQENSLRPGTESLPLIAAFGMAAELAQTRIVENERHSEAIREYFVNKIGKIDGICMNSPSDATPYICNISIEKANESRFVKSEILLHYLAARGVFVSSGSACAKGKASHVLTAMGLPRERVESAIRVSFSRHTATDDIDAFIDILIQGLEEIKV